ARISLFIGLAAAFIDLVVGVIWGSISGYIGGKVDEYMMRIADILTGLPYLLVVVLLTVILTKGLFSIILAMTITGWINMARNVRVEVLRLKSQEYGLDANSLGSNELRSMTKCTIPNMLGQIIVTLRLTVPNGIFTEAFLSFCGLEVPQRQASGGTMTSDA